MNPGLFFALLFGLTLSLPGAELLQEWNLGAEKVPGMRYPAKQVTFRPAEEKTPAGDPCGEFTILEAKEGSAPWSLQINFVSKQTIVPGGVTVTASASRGIAPPKWGRTAFRIRSRGR